MKDVIHKPTLLLAACLAVAWLAAPLVAQAPVLFSRVRVGTVDIRTGAGTPEGSITAPVGSLFLRTDGGAGTSFYVKETGAGNTGWVAK